MQAIEHSFFDRKIPLEVSLNSPIEDPNPLRAGSVCHVAWCESVGWSIMTAEPRKFIDDTIAVPVPYVYT